MMERLNRAAAAFDVAFLNKITKIPVSIDFWFVLLVDSNEMKIGDMSFRIVDKIFGFT